MSYTYTTTVTLNTEEFGSLTFDSVKDAQDAAKHLNPDTNITLSVVKARTSPVTSVRDFLASPAHLIDAEG